MYQFDEIIDRKGTQCSKWDELESKFKNPSALPLWVADMDFAIPEELVHAIKERAAHPTYGYTFPSEKYYENIIHWNKKRNNYTIHKEEIVPVPGIV
ncbi:MAG: putative C-S lyase, partial [Clostridiales bacterium]|nr:putative C-S lyase [Clostridiales bacterium]